VKKVSSPPAHCPSA